MNDRESVIKGLEFTKAMITFNPSTGEDIEPENLNEADKTSYDACVDAIELLKEQEEGKPKGHWMPYEPDKRGYTNGFTCSRCERVILSDHYCKMIDFDFCPYCGAYMDNAEGR